MKKKLILSIGSIAAIAAPITAVIACNSDSDNKSDDTSKAVDTEFKIAYSKWGKDSLLENTGWKEFFHAFMNGGFNREAKLKITINGKEYKRNTSDANKWTDAEWKKIKHAREVDDLAGTAANFVFTVINVLIPEGEDRNLALAEARSAIISSKIHAQGVEVFDNKKLVEDVNKISFKRSAKPITKENFGTDNSTSFHDFFHHLNLGWYGDYVKKQEGTKYIAVSITNDDASNVYTFEFTKDLFDELGLRRKNGKPHAQVINFIIENLFKVPADETFKQRAIREKDKISFMSAARTSLEKVSKHQASAKGITEYDASETQTLNSKIIFDKLFAKSVGGALRPTVPPVGVTLQFNDSKDKKIAEYVIKDGDSQKYFKGYQVAPFAKTWWVFENLYDAILTQDKLMSDTDKDKLYRSMLRVINEFGKNDHHVQVSYGDKDKKAFEGNVKGNKAKEAGKKKFTKKVGGRVWWPVTPEMLVPGKPAAKATPKKPAPKVAKPVIVTNGYAMHSVFGKASRKLPKVGTVLQFGASNSTHYKHTWTQADTTALSGFLGKTKHQNDVIEYLSTVVVEYGSNGKKAANQENVATGFKEIIGNRPNGHNAEKPANNK